MKLIRYASSSTLSAVAAGLLLVGCGGGGSSPGTSNPVVNPDPNPDEPFFNSDAKFSYADSLVGKFAGIFRTAVEASSGLQAKRTIAAVENLNIDCQSGGTMNMSVTTDDATGEPSALSVNFNSCRNGSETSNGSINLSSNLDATGDNGTVVMSANNFSVTGGVDPVSVNGEVTISMQTNGDQSTASISGPSLSMTAGSESLTFSNYSIVAVENSSTDAASLSGRVTIASSIDGTINVEISPALTSDVDADYPTAGRLVMTHSDGSSLALDADNGDPNTFNYTITENGTVTSGVANWADTELDDL